MQKVNLPTNNQSVLPEGLKDLIEELYDRIQKTYLSDDRPWVIGYSGGKDSTVTLQAVWYALKRLPATKLIKPVYVISSDTYVETPVIVNYIQKNISNINSFAKEQGLPIQADIVRPDIDETFWVNLIGRGYPAPYNKFRWCTDRLKIKPANHYIREKVAAYGEVVVVLGVRKEESSNRAGQMAKRHMVGEKLSRHSDLTNAFVFSPIEDWYTDEVWRYLLTTESPWGGNNQDLATMYKNAQDGECPLVIDKDTPSCGNSRFGCWVCTVVTRDASMEAMIDKGQEWMKPLLDFRDWLADTQDPDGKPLIREHRRRTGKIQYREVDGEKKIIWGPYTLDFRKIILTELLKTEKQVRKKSPNAEETLITKDELVRIRHLWRFDEGDWSDSLPQIYLEVTGEEFSVTNDDWSGVGKMEQEILEVVCQKHDIPIKLVTELFDAEKRQNGMSRRSKIYNNIESILKKDWRSRESVLAEVGIQHTNEK